MSVLNNNDGKEQSLISESKDNLVKWHKRLGHIGYTGLEKLAKQHLVVGLDNDLEFTDIEFCESCVNAKMTKLPFNTRERSQRFLEIIHSDVCGPITPEAHDGSKYFVTFIEDFTNFTVVYLFKNKSQVFECIQDYLKMTQARFNSKIAKLRCDNGEEYVSKEFMKYCSKKGIVLDYTVPYTPQQNGKAERMNRTLVERARAMLVDSKVDKMFWGEAVLTAAYIINRGPTESLKSNVTPAEMWYGKKPNISNLRIFGCTAYSHVEKQFRYKFDSKTEKCMLLGYAQSGYRLSDFNKNKVVVSRNVKIDIIHRCTICNCEHLDINYEPALKGL